jgi:hypothetical protein
MKVAVKPIRKSNWRFLQGNPENDAPNDFANSKQPKRVNQKFFRHLDSSPLIKRSKDWPHNE